MWHSVSEKPPFTDFLWCRFESGLVGLAYHHDGNFQEAVTVGDNEGLSVDYHYDVTHWCELVPPSFTEPSNK